MAAFTGYTQGADTNIREKMPKITALDHLVLTVSNLPATLTFYTQALGMTAQEFSASDGTTRFAVKFGHQKINLHPAKSPFAPHAKTPLPGSADLCLVTEDSLAQWVEHLGQHNITIEDGLVPRSGAKGPITSIYLRDPDGNLIEISSYG